MKMDLKCDGLSGVAVLQKEEVKGLSPVAEAELETEQSFIQGLTESISAIFTNMGVKDPFYLRVYEYKNHADTPTWEIMVTNQDWDERYDVFQSEPRRRLFTTSLHQQYVAFYRPDHGEDYAGKIGIELMMFGRVGKFGHWLKDECAENLAFLTLIEYYRKIVEFYPEWKTHYIDAPLIKSWSITRLEE